MSYRLAILKNEDNFDYKFWIKSCKMRSDITYDVVDLISNNWIEILTAKKYDLLLARPPGKTELFKRLYDERINIINDYLKMPIYPSLPEILIYENKRYLRDWLTINKIPHPITNVFFRKEEANSFAKNNNVFPIVAKTNIGASGNGIQILNSRNEILLYINKAFSVGIKSIKGPKLKKGSVLKKVKKLTRKGFIKNRLSDYSSSSLDIQYNYVILQEFIQHEFEWRCVKIGNSYFAHKKIAKNGKTSGTLLKGYNQVPLRLLSFVKNISEIMNLNSVAIDIFERNDELLINEIQCFFGQSDPYQMLVDGKPGRYINRNDNWKFEEGMFNTNQSYDLRLEHAISLIKK